MAITLYMTPLSPPVRAVLLTAEALGIKLQLKHVDLRSGEHLTEDFQKLNPQHTIPVLDDNGTVIWDSHAIITYLVRKYGKNDDLYPKDYAKRALVDQRLHFDTGSAFAVLRAIVRSILYKGVKTLTDEAVASIEEVYDFLEKFLVNKKWVAGDSVTVADISLISTVTSLDKMLAVDGKKYSNVVRWILQAEALPFYHVNVAGLGDFETLFKSLIS